MTKNKIDVKKENLKRLTNEELRKKERYSISLVVLSAITFLSMLYLGIQGFSSVNKLEMLIPLILGTASVVLFFPAFKMLKEIRVELKGRDYKR